MHELSLSKILVGQKSQLGHACFKVAQNIRRHLLSFETLRCQLELAPFKVINFSCILIRRAITSVSHVHSTFGLTYRAALSAPWKFCESSSKKPVKRARFLSREKSEQLHICYFTKVDKPNTQN